MSAILQQCQQFLSSISNLGAVSAFLEQCQTCVSNIDPSMPALYSMSIGRIVKRLAYRAKFATQVSDSICADWKLIEYADYNQAIPILTRRYTKLAAGVHSSCSSSCTQMKIHSYICCIVGQTRGFSLAWACVIPVPNLQYRCQYCT